MTFKIHLLLKNTNWPCIIWKKKYYFCIKDWSRCEVRGIVVNCLLLEQKSMLNLKKRGFKASLYLLQHQGPFQWRHLIVMQTNTPPAFNREPQWPQGTTQSVCAHQCPYFAVIHRREDMVSLSAKGNSAFRAYTTLDSLLLQIFTFERFHLINSESHRDH